jgi:hypothetical protein
MIVSIRYVFGNHNDVIYGDGEINGTNERITPVYSAKGKLKEYRCILHNGDIMFVKAKNVVSVTYGAGTQDG